MKKNISKIIFLIFLLFFNFNFLGCQTTQNSQQEIEYSNEQEDTNFLDDAVLLSRNGEYYESDGLIIETGKTYVFKLPKRGQKMSTIYLYNTKKRMGNEFLDGQVEGKENDTTYWTVRVFDQDKKEIVFDNLNYLTSQFCFSDDWNDFYEFQENKIYYFQIKITKDHNGLFYLSLY